MHDFSSYLLRLSVAAILCLTFTSGAEALVSSGGFVRNDGQMDGRVLYYAEQGPATVFLTREGIVLDLRSPAASLNGDEPSRPCWAAGLLFDGAQHLPVAVGRHERGGLRHYLIGSDPSGWRTNVVSYDEVIYSGLWDGIDLVLRLNSSEVTCRMEFARGVDPAEARLRFDGGEGDESAKSGFDRLLTPWGASVELRKDAHEWTLAWVPGQASPTMRSDGGPQSLVEPARGLDWSTYLGGGDYDHPYDVVVDDAGAIYVAGNTYSADFPATLGAYDETFNGPAAPNGGDAFVAKVDSTGSDVIWATYIGGSGMDWGRTLAIDGQAGPIVAGTTYSTDFPLTMDAIDSLFEQQNEGFVARLSTSGDSLVWSTYLGGELTEDVYAAAIGPTGAVFVAGGTASDEFPTTTGAYTETPCDDHSDVFVTRLNGATGALEAGTFLCGPGWDCATGIAVQPGGDVVVVGTTGSGNFPTTPGAFDQTHDPGSDAFITCVSPLCDTLRWGTFLGGYAEDLCYSVCLDSEGNVIVGGRTHSYDFPITRLHFDNEHNGCSGFMAKFTALQGSIMWSTFVGATGCLGIAVDSEDHPAIITYAPVWFPTTPGAFDGSHNGGDDAVLAKLVTGGTALLWSSYFGGDQMDQPTAVAPAGPYGFAMVGVTRSAGFPTTSGVLGETYFGGYDAFVVRLKLPDGPTGIDDDESVAPLVVCAPNPFRGSTTVHYESESVGSQVELRIYDVAGRGVTTLHGVVPSALAGTISWNGRDALGIAVASGVYPYELRVGAEVLRGRMVLLR